MNKKSHYSDLKSINQIAQSKEKNQQKKTKVAEYEMYKRLKILGEGSFGKAYLVECLQDKKKYVLKQMDMQAMTLDEKKQTYKEAKILSTLSHPNIVFFKDVYRTKLGKLCIVMEYADGGDLQQKIKEESQKKKLFDEKQVLDWFTQICLAIKHIHDRKIVHRDLKGQNIFITKENRIKLGDFGIARQLQQTLEKCKTMVGTPYYLSPEIIENQPYSFQSDIWSLGIILYEICAQKPPFNANSLHQLALKIVRGEYSEIPSKYSLGLRQLIKKMLSLKPQQRPTINQILGSDVVVNRIREFLSETQKHQEFDRTIIHNKQILHDSQLDMSEITTVNNEKPMPSHLLLKLKYEEQKKQEELKKQEQLKKQDELRKLQKQHLLQQQQQLVQIKQTKDREIQQQKEKMKQQEKQDNYPKLPLINQQQAYIPDPLSGRNLYTPQTNAFRKKQHNEQPNKDNVYFPNYNKPSKLGNIDDQIEKVEQYKIKKVNKILVTKPMTPGNNMQKKLPSAHKFDRQAAQTPGSKCQFTTQNTNFTNFSKASNNSNHSNFTRQKSQPNILQVQDYDVHQRRKSVNKANVNYEKINQQRSVSRGGKSNYSNNKNNNNKFSKQSSRSNSINSQRANSVYSQDKYKNKNNYNQKSSYQNTNSSKNLQKKDSNNSSRSQSKNRNKSKGKRDLSSGSSKKQTSQSNLNSGSNNNNNNQYGVKLSSKAQDRLNMIKKKNTEDARKKLESAPSSDVKKFGGANQANQKSQAYLEKEEKKKQEIINQRKEKEEERQKKREQMIKEIENNRHQKKQFKINEKQPSTNLRIKTESDCHHEENNESTKEKQYQIKTVQKNRLQNKSEASISTKGESSSQKKVSQNYNSDEKKHLFELDSYEFSDQHHHEFPGFHNQHKKVDHNYRQQQDQKELQKISVSMPTDQIQPIKNKFNQQQQQQQQLQQEATVPNQNISHVKQLSQSNAQPFGLARPKTSNRKKIENFGNKNNENNSNRPIKPQLLINNRLNTPQSQQTISSLGEQNSSSKQNLQNEENRIYQNSRDTEQSIQKNIKHQRIYDADNNIEELKQVQEQNKKLFNFDELQFIVDHAANKVNNIPEIPYYDSNKNYFNLNTTQLEDRDVMLTVKSDQDTLKIQKNSHLDQKKKLNSDQTQYNNSNNNKQLDEQTRKHKKKSYDDINQSQQNEEIKSNDIKENFEFEFNFEPNYTQVPNYENILQSQGQYYYDDEDYEVEVEDDKDFESDNYMQNQEQMGINQQNKNYIEKTQNQSYYTTNNMNIEHEQEMSELDNEYLKMKNIKTVIIDKIGQEKYDKSYKILQKEIYDNHDIKEISEKHKGDNYESLLPFLSDIQRKELVSAILIVILTEEQMA